MTDIEDGHDLFPESNVNDGITIHENAAAAVTLITKSKPAGIKHKLHRGRKDDHLNPILKELTKSTHFTHEQIQALSKIYARLTANGKMDRFRFRDFIYSTFDITEDIILDRMFHVFCEGTGAVAVVSEIQWISCLSVLTRGNLEEKMAYVFQLYDIAGDMTISREEVDHFLRNCVLTSYGVGGVDLDDVPDAIKDIGDIIFKRLDVDRNGLITPDDFFQACSNDPMLLEALGQCLPSNKYIKSFLILFADDYTHLDAGYSVTKTHRGHEMVRSRSSSIISTLSK